MRTGIVRERNGLEFKLTFLSLRTVLTNFLLRLTRECVAIPNHVQIQKLIKVLGTDFALSQNSNMRKGGLIGLAAMAIALGKVREQI